MHLYLNIEYWILEYSVFWSYQMCWKKNRVKQASSSFPSPSLADNLRRLWTMEEACGRSTADSGSPFSFRQLLSESLCADFDWLRGALLCLFEMKTDGSHSLYSCAVKPEGRPRGNNDRSRPRRWHRRPPLQKKLHNNWNYSTADVRRGGALEQSSF